MKVLCCFLLLMFMGCGKKKAEKSSTQKQNVSAFFKSQEIKVNVYYEVGAEPYISDSPLFEYWTILEQNLKSLFTGRKIEPTLSIPKILANMTSMPDSKDVSWTLDEVKNLSTKMATSSSPTTFEVYFLNGVADEDSGIIGFHINGTNIIAIFKDVIRSTGSGDPLALVPKYVEQATLIHEIGHALGLVNNGIPMKTNHHDKEHGAHCDNTKCVMYWSNEGASNLATFAQSVLTSGNLIMFDDKCLKDARSF